MINDRHAKLLEARGFDIEVLENLGIESSTKLGPDTIAIPIFEAGARINTKYRTIGGEKRFLQEPGAKPVVWNVDRITDETLKDNRSLSPRANSMRSRQSNPASAGSYRFPTAPRRRKTRTPAIATGSSKTPRRRCMPAKRSFSPPIQTALASS